MNTKRRSKSQWILSQRTVNFRALAIQMAVLAVVTVLMVAMYFFQRPRNAAFLVTKAEQAASEGQFQDAVRYQRMYLGLNSGDHDAYAKLATLLTQVGTIDADYEAFDKLQQALRRDPEDLDRQKLLLDLSLRLGEKRQALEQAKVLTAAAEKGDGLLWWPIARAYRLNNNIDEALANYKKMIEAHPGNLQAYREYLELQQQKNRDPQQLAREINELLKRNPENATAFLMAYVFRRDFKLPEATEALDTARRLAPGNLEVLLMAIGEAIRTNSSQTASLFEQATQAFPAEPRLRLLRGRWVQGQGDLEQAAKIYQEGFQQSAGDSAEFAWRAADLLLLTNRIAEVKPYMAALQQVSSYRPVYEYLRGRLALLSNNFPAATEHLAAATLLLESPYNRNVLGDTSVEMDYAVALANATLWHQQGQLGKAIDYASRARQIFPSQSLPWITIASLYLQIGQYDNSVAAWREVMQRPPYPQAVYFELARGILYSLARPIPMAEDFSEYENAYDQALRRTPNSPDLVALEAEYLLYTGHYVDAIATLQAGHQGHPRDWSLGLSLAQAHLLAGRPADGLLVVAPIRRRLGINAPIALTQARLQWEQGDAKAADTTLEKALKAVPESQRPPLVLSRANLAWTSGNLDEAAKLYHHVIELSPEDEFARAFLLAFLIETQEWQSARQTIDGWKVPQLDALSLWGNCVYAVAKDGIDKVDPKLLTGFYDSLRKRRPFWWGTDEAAGMVAERNGDKRRALTTYTSALWTGPGMPFLLRRMTNVVPDGSTEELKRKIRIAMLRRMPVPGDTAWPAVKP